jgi:diguanylate cyclase (GGDEF)-like protein
MHHELERLAMLDPVTDCHNRRSIMRVLDASLAKHATESPGTAVIFVDIDHFKQVNDTLGHAAGDELLRVVADRLRGTVRAGDIVGRIGGDEFLVICPQTSVAEEVSNLGWRIAEVLGNNVSLSSGVVETRASIGVAWTGSVAVDADRLVGEADGAMYESKRGGAGRPVLFNRSSLSTPSPRPPSSVEGEMRAPDGPADRVFPAAG